MTFIVKDRIKDSYTGTPGTGDVTLSGTAPTGFRAFDSQYGHSAGSFFPYVIDHGSEWEVGIGHLSASTTLVRDTVLSSSNSGSLVSFTSGLNEVYSDVPTAMLIGTKGADVASAGTLDLNAATGELIDVTGTTTITAVTLREGGFRTVRFTGALTLTHGSSLVLPGVANITTAAGDFAIFRGYASSVVRCVSYTKADGTAVVSSGGGGGSTGTTNILLSSTSVNLNEGTAAKQTLYTCPSSRRVIITGVVFQKLSGNWLATDASIGWGSDARGVFNGSSLPSYGPDPSGAIVGQITDLNDGIQTMAYPTIGTAGDVLGLIVNTPEGSALTAIVDIFGYLTNTSGVPQANISIP